MKCKWLHEVQNYQALARVLFWAPEFFNRIDPLQPFTQEI
jgi:hypothetical protein